MGLNSKLKDNIKVCYAYNDLIVGVALRKNGTKNKKFNALCPYVFVFHFILFLLFNVMIHIRIN